MKDAFLFPKFDQDIHCVGTTISWPFDHLEQINTPSVNQPGTEEEVPKLRDASPLKRVRPEIWEQNVRKRRINSGQRHEHTVKKGKNKGKKTVVKEKEMKSGCKVGECRMGCSEDFGEEERLKIFKAFYNLKSIDEKRNFLNQRVKRKAAKRTRKRWAKVRTAGTERKQRERGSTYEYSFVNPGNNQYDIRVCQKMFLDTLSISKTMVTTALCDKRTDEGTVKEDMRGRHGKHRRMDKSRKQIVINHIMSFRCLKSHYVRKTRKEQFLPSELTLKGMHRMYIKYCQDNNYKIESYDFYRRIFNRSFDLKFGKPKKDQCNTCTTFENGEKTPKDIKAHEKHIKDKEHTRKLKETMKNDADEVEEVVAAAFDLEQVLLSPYGPTGAYYYSRRLKNHNFTVTELNNMNTYCYLWNEHECAKGSCEIATGLRKFIEIKHAEGAKKIFFFSDRCGGQNQNRMVFLMLSEAAVRLRLTWIELCFLVVGHSQNENDTAHSTIERNYRGKTIYTTAQWEVTIKDAFKKNECFLETLVYGKIINFKSTECFPQYTTLLNDKCVDEATKKKVMWKSIVQAKFTSDGKMQFKYDYEKDYSTTKLTNTTRAQKKKGGVNMAKYTAPLGITKAKKADLLKLCKKKLIPEAHHQFYELLSTNSSKDDDDDEAVK